MMLKKHLHGNHYGDYVVYDTHNLLVHIRLHYPTNIKLNKDHTHLTQMMHEQIFVQYSGKQRSLHLPHRPRTCS